MSRKEIKMPNYKLLILAVIGVVLAGGIVVSAKSQRKRNLGCGGCGQSSGQCATSAPDKDAKQAEVYSCPKHPDFITTDPNAKCPDGMQVQLMKLYACPMHPDQMTTDPDAKCSICNMKMEPVMKQLYVCPMHADQISTDPDAKCSICAMKMVPFNPQDSDNSNNSSDSGDSNSGK